MVFELSSNKVVSKNHRGKIRLIEHSSEPFLSPSIQEPTPEQLADQYIAEVAPIYQINSGQLRDLSSALGEVPTQEGTQLHRYKSKDIAGSFVVDYIQSYRGIPVWRADLSVQIARDPLRVTSSLNNLHDSITLGNDPEKAAEDYKERLVPEEISKLLGLKKGKGISKINSMRLVIYQFDPAQRVETETGEPEGKNVSFEEAPPALALPPLPKTIEAGKHYVVVEVLFDLDLPGWKGMHWLALVEPISGAVLYVRPLVSSATGKIFRMDPISLSGDSSLIPSAPEASLVAWASSAPITELTSQTPQDLRGSQVDLQDIEPPSPAEPKTTSPFDFSYAVKTTDFTATNAYYHVNWFFNLIKGMGFNLSTYFDGTTFPVPVDWWSLGGSSNVNAHCPGNAAGNGIGHFCFASAQSGQTVGIADDVRVVIHEFGHGLLWDHVNSPNFGFAHSAGDALGAILMDPSSRAPDRFLTFPWPQSGGGPLDRRHDRKVSDGWGWFGSRYNTQYGGEQVLSTTLFRLYRSVGGDSPYPGDRAWSSRYISYLIIKAIGLLTNTTSFPEDFVAVLQKADDPATIFEGQPGGALYKVIRWAFEKQGLYQPNARPNLPAGTPKVTTEGNPPDVDVYIDDGRHGEYQYLYAFWDNQDMWARRSPDGGTVHQNPAIGVPNYMYVRVKNRGTKQANNVKVKAYHCNPGTAMLWPDHWSPMDTPILSASGPIPSGGETIVGPFKWTPKVYGHECLLAIASADGDDANDTRVTKPIPISHFIPFDNNIGQRNVHPVYVLMKKNWVEILKGIKLPLQVVNPFERAAKVELVPILPKVLQNEKLWVFFSSSGGNKFELGSREKKQAVFSIVSSPKIPSRRPWALSKESPKPGILQPEEFINDLQPGSLEEASLTMRPVKFQIVALINGQNMGGMTYLLQPSKVLPKEGPIGLEEGELEEIPVSPAEGEDIAPIFENLRQNPNIKNFRLRKIDLEIEFKEQ